MKKIFFILPILFLLLACSPEENDMWIGLTSNITDDTLWNVTHKYLNLNVKWCAIPALYPQPPRLNPASRCYVPSKYNCYPTRSGGICGYDCKIAGGRIKCGYLPAQRCIVGSSNYIACGYDCIKTSREANCGIRYGDTCAVSQSLQVICGLNCHDINGFVRCEPSPSFRADFPQTNWP